MSAVHENSSYRTFKHVWRVLDDLTAANLCLAGFDICLTDVNVQELEEVGQLVRSDARLRLREQGDYIGHYHVLYEWP